MQLHETEEALLGALLVDDGLVETVVGRVRPDDFSTKKHQDIFGVIEGQHNAGESTDLMSIARCLKKMDIGGLTLTTLTHLMDRATILTGLEHYADHISEAAKHRRMAHEARCLANACVVGNEEQIAEAIRALNDCWETGSGAKVQTLSDACHSYIRYLESLETGAVTTWRTEMSLFDDVVNKGLGGGLRPGQLLICCGRAGAGKTTTALYLVQQLMKYNRELEATFFSLELSASSLGGKVLRSEMVYDKSKPFLDNARSGARRVDDTYGSRVQIVDHSGMTPSSILSMARRMAKKGTKIFVIDHLHRVSYPSWQDLRHQIGDLCKKFTDFAKDYDCLFIVCAQLNRESEKLQRAPTTSDISESGQVEQHADIILAVHSDRNRRDMINFSLLKNRFGPPVTRQFRVSYEHQRFQEVEG